MPYADIERIEDELGAAERDAEALVAGLSEDQGAWRAAAGSWSVSECLDHLATANRVYLRAMDGAAARASDKGRRRKGAAEPGLIGRWFVRMLEPPARSGYKQQAPRIIRPRSSPGLADAFAAFRASQENVRAFLRTYAEIDLAGVRFPNPFLRGVRFSLATGLHAITAHERRHLWQAWKVREGAMKPNGPFVRPTHPERNAIS